MFSHTEPAILHGNGPSKITLNYLSNYIPNVWNSVDGCIKCKQNHINLNNTPASELPLVFIAVFIEINTPFLEEQLKKIQALEYPKDRIHLFVHNSVSKLHSII